MSKRTVVPVSKRVVVCLVCLVEQMPAQNQQLSPSTFFIQTQLLLSHPTQVYVLISGLHLCPIPPQGWLALDT